MQDKLMLWHFPKNETRLAYPGESLMLSDPLAAHCLEEMRSLEIERQHDVAAQRWQRLGRRDACGDVMPAGAGIDESLIAQRLYEVESRCRGSGSDPCACDY